MRRVGMTGWLFVLVAALASGACAEDVAPIPTEPTPTPIEVQFSGTLTVNGAVVRPFSVSDQGLVTATLATLDPNPNSEQIVGVGLGTWNGSACQVLLANDTTFAGNSLIGQANTIGEFCVRIYDVGKLTGPVEFRINIVHF